MKQYVLMAWIPYQKKMKSNFHFYLSYTVSYGLLTKIKRIIMTIGNQVHFPLLLIILKYLKYFL